MSGEFAWTKVGDFRVSTVWLGEGVVRHPGSILYENDAELRDLILFQDQYVTEQQAYEGHQRVCEDVRGVLKRVGSRHQHPGLI